MKNNFIGHNLQLVDKQVAEKQAMWLEKVLAEEHERIASHSISEPRSTGPRRRIN
jgi:hypothetical protein